MGRLTLNVLLSFAQFEQEVTGERIRDKIAASKKKGIWVGGIIPFGYRLENRKLVIEESEARVVRLIFERYLALASIRTLERELNSAGILSRRRRRRASRNRRTLAAARERCRKGRDRAGCAVNGGFRRQSVRQRNDAHQRNTRTAQGYLGNRAIVRPRVIVPRCSS
jgi:DNA invertase Pin-like site-specific DNA recombinase